MTRVLISQNEPESSKCHRPGLPVYDEGQGYLLTFFHPGETLPQLALRPPACFTPVFSLSYANPVRMTSLGHIILVLEIDLTK